MTVPLTLTGKQRRHLRALAHSYKPVVQIGHVGLTEAVVGAIDQALETHELVKVRVSADVTEPLDGIGQAVAEKTQSNLAQVIGRTLLLYRRRRDEPSIVLPKDSARKASAKGG